MILDTSAVIAIVRGEPERERFLDLAVAADRVVIGAPTLVETGVVVDGMGNPAASRKLDALLDQLRAVTVPFDEAQAQIARAAYRDFGKGSGHPAKLNFGDCLAYAAAKATGEPLLFKGDGFIHTDLAHEWPDTEEP